MKRTLEATVSEAHSHDILVTYAQMVRNVHILRDYFNALAESLSLCWPQEVTEIIACLAHTLHRKEVIFYVESLTGVCNNTKLYNQLSEISRQLPRSAKLLLTCYRQSWIDNIASPSESTEFHILTIGCEEHEWDFYGMTHYFAEQSKSEGPRCLLTQPHRYIINWTIHNDIVTTNYARWVCFILDDDVDSGVLMETVGNRYTMDRVKEAFTRREDALLRRMALDTQGSASHHVTLSLQ